VCTFCSSTQLLFKKANTYITVKVSRQSPDKHFSLPFEVYSFRPPHCRNLTAVYIAYWAAYFLDTCLSYINNTIAVPCYRTAFVLHIPITADVQVTSVAYRSGVTSGDSSWNQVWVRLIECLFKVKFRNVDYFGCHCVFLSLDSLLIIVFFFHLIPC
jgi:hypothetical protein